MSFGLFMLNIKQGESKMVCHSYYLEMVGDGSLVNRQDKSEKNKFIKLYTIMKKSYMIHM